MNKYIPETAFNFIRDYIQTHTYPPTIREIAAYVGTSRTNMYYHLQRMAEGGWITWKCNSPRTIRITRDDRERP